MGQNRQRDVRAHGSGGLLPGMGHGQDRVLDLLVGIAEGAVEPVAHFLGMSRHLGVGRGQFGELYQILVEPLAVGLPGGVVVLDLVVGEQHAALCVHQQHFARAQTILANNVRLVDVQHPHLGREDQPVVIGEIIPGRPQAVAVKERAHQLSVGKEDRGRTVPGLHHGGVIAVHVPLLSAHGPVVFPGLRDREHHGQRQVDAVHDQKLDGVVEHG